MDLSLQVSESNHHIHQCPVHTQSSHVQHRGYDQCGHEHQWQGASDFPWIFLDRWNHCLAQYHNWYNVLHIYEGFELWIYLDSIPSYTIDFTNAPEIQSILGFEWSVFVKGVDNPRRYFMSTVWNQVVMTNGYISHLQSMFTGIIPCICSSSRQRASRWWRYFLSYRWWSRKSMWNSMFENMGGILIVIVAIRQSMVLVRLLGSHCPHPYTICVWSVPQMVLSSIKMVNPCLMWWTIIVLEEMHASIHPISNNTGNWVPRTTNSSINLS